MRGGVRDLYKLFPNKSRRNAIIYFIHRVFMFAFPVAELWAFFFFNRLLIKIDKKSVNH